MSAFAILFGTLASVRAQVVADGATNTLSNTTNSFASVTVGTNGAFTLLTLSNNALLTNSGNGAIGLNVTARSNEVRLISPTGRWRMGNNLFVGSNGAFSRLVISNGALVENFNGVLANVASSSNNAVFVIGAGSVWSNRGDLTVGFSGRDNQLIVSNGGFVFNRFGYLGQQPGGSNNIARVTGNGSVWSNQFDLRVGANDRSNRLIIDAGGFVTSANGVVSGSSSSGNNEVLVSGPGSVWSNQFLFFGDVAGRNRLVVSNGATLWSGVGILGSLSLALSNQVIVTGPGSVWTNESSLSLAESSQGNRVEVSDGGRLECVDGLLGQTLAANSNAVLLTGNGSAWNNRASLIVGNSGSGNTLTASNGAIITASNLTIGVTANAAGNQVAVEGGALRVTNAAGTGLLDVRRGTVSLRSGSVDADRLLITNATGGFQLAGGTLITRGAAISNIGGLSISGSTANPALWDVRAGTAHALGVTLSVGSSLSFNQMLITNGGTLTSGDAYIGSNAGSSSNVVLLSGSGSKWTAANLDVGNGGTFNRLIISSGATVDDFNGALGKNSGSSNNLAVVTGAGSLWSNRNEMYVGYQGGGNQLVISNGGTAFAQATRFLGHNGGDISNNIAIVTGSGSRWLGPGNIEVGGPGAFSQLLVTAGGLVQNNLGLIGSGSSANNNLAMIAGAGSVWSNASDLRIGSSGAFNSLIVSNGAFVRNNSGYLGFNLNASNNLAIVTGTGSVWSNLSSLVIGNASQGNRLVVSNGAMLRDTSGYVGLDSIGNNLAIVTGAGSLWTNSEDTLIGTFGAGNRLQVSNAGAVRNKNGFIGVDASASNNVALVSDAGSVWSNALDLYVGYSAMRNQLVVSNGGSIFGASNAFIGFNATAVSNSAIVTGVGSRWSLGQSLFIGSNAAFNALIVSNGGQVANRITELGFLASAGSNNLALVTDPGSVWSNRQAIIGRFSSGNRLHIFNGGRVNSDILTMGANLSASNNAALISGGGSLLEISDSLAAGSSSVGNRLTISNGAAVRSFRGQIGFSASGSNNQVVITGPASVWSNVTTLFAGGAGQNNRLIVTNGGAVIAGDRIALGEFSSSTNNCVTVDDGTLLVTNALMAGKLDVRRGTNVLNSGLINVDLLLLTNTLSKFEFNGGSLVTRGLVISNSGSFTIGSTGSVPAVWRLLPGPVDHFTDFQINVGGSGSFAQLIHTNGALLTNTAFIDIGESPSSRSNAFTLAGSDSRCWLGDGMIIGRSGSENRLVVRGGASLVTASISYLGFNVTSSNNEAVVTGPGTSWTTANYGLRLGNEGRNNRLLVSDGGLVSSFDDWIGVNSSSSNNQALVTGAGSVWNNTRDLAVGLNGSGNQLVVSNGATVLTAANRYVGQNDGAFSNTAIITDPGSAWLGDGSLYVGLDGSSNRLFVRNGARVAGGIAALGGLAAADGNQALVTDSGSSWTNQLDLNVGEGGSGNRLTISNAATLAGLSHAFIGRNSTAASNSVTVTDPGSRWLIRSNLFVGSNGPAASLVVVNGGRVENSFATLGGGLSSSNNRALISGAGSIWSNRNHLDVGGLSQGNSLVVSNGAQVQSDFAALSVGFSSSNNEALVTGAGSMWSNRNELHVGRLGPANKLVIANGGKVDCNHATVGLNTSASNNLAIVTDAGSFWHINISLNIGNSSGGNRLVVSNGASMSADGATIGLFSANNEALATGPGTGWTNRVAISVGQLLGHNQLVISDGAFVLAGNVFVSSHPDSTNNRVVIQGGTLLVTNTTGGVGALDVRRGTNVVDAGLIDVARLFVTNALGQFEFNGGTLVSSGTAINNGRGFQVGNGTNPATFTLRNGTHSFANNLVVASNATLRGNGTVTGVLTTQPGGRISPGVSVGTIVLSNSPSLQGTAVMEISKDGPVPINDQIQVVGPLTFGGSLIISNLGPNVLAAGDRFTLFSASSYSGAFADITLPTLPVTLAWTNKLAVDGSIAVIPYVPPAVELTVQLVNGLLQVSWPTNGADYCLETSYDLTPPISWQTVSGGITTSGVSFVYTLGSVSQATKQFFRLAFPCSPTPLVLSLQLSNNLVTVSWPSNEFRLETTFNLAPPVSWQTINHGIVDVGAIRTFTLTNSPAATNQFFRLSFP